MRKNKRKIPRELLSTSDVPPGTFAAIDLQSKKLFIPLDAMLDTRALHRGGVPSICRVFFKGRCRQGANCFQAHAVESVVEKLRAIALNEPSCCKQHGAVSDDADIDRKTILIVKDQNGKVVCSATIDQTMMTKGLRKLIKSQSSDENAQKEVQVIIPAASLCRQHSISVQGQSCCCFSNECMFVHLCRQIDCTSSRSGESETAVKDNTQKAQIVDKVSRTISECGVAQVAQFTTHDTPLMLPPNSLQPDHSPLPIIEVCPINDDAKAPDGQSELSSLSFALGPTHVSNSSSCNFSCFSKSIEFTKHGCVWRHNPYAQCSLPTVEF